MSARVWLHGRKGRIVGEVVGGDDTWTRIHLAEDAWADVRHRRRHEAGTVQTYRTDLLVEMKPTLTRYADELTPGGNA